jgi:hypothetical protein
MRIPLFVGTLLLLPALLATRSAPAAKPGDSVTLRRGPCFGNCPIYEVTLRSDGRATYRGGDYAPRSGEYEGSVDPAAVEMLLDRLDDVDFWQMRPDRQLQVQDLPEMVLTAERANRRRHRVHTNLPPRELEPIQAAIDSVANQVDWRPIQEQRRRGAAAASPGAPEPSGR